MRGLKHFATYSSFAILAAAASACSSSPESSESVGKSSEGIVSGQPDTTHQAVVSIYGEQGNSAMLCSGTIVAVDASRQMGYVLTAAHCLAFPPKYVYVGDDFRAHATARLGVVDYQAHPSYAGEVTSSYDFALVRVTGVDATTPVMPFLRPEQDKLAADSVVTCVGFGRTTEPPASNENTQRQSIDRTLDSVTTTKLSYSLATGGICNGDSGGPALVNIDGTAYVAGVHSYVTGNCDGTGVSGRISAAADWVSQVVAQPPPGPQCGYPWSGGGCALCTDASCCDELAACAADGTCRTCLDQNDAPEACATNDKRLALARCREQSCSATCGEKDAVWAGATDTNGSFANLASARAAGGCAMASASESPSEGALSVLGVLAAAGMLRRRRRSVR